MALSKTPAPFLVSPSWTFDGDDGLWSTFSISVGTPPQSFRVVPSTASSETWIPVPQACQGILINVTDCNMLRGVNDNNGTVSLGFQTNESSTWDQIGIYGLTSEVNLYGGTNDGLYGLDAVTLSSTTGGNGQNVSGQTVAGISTTDFWLGSIGLGPALGNFSTRDTNIPSLLDTMMSQYLIPSLSFGYSAGAAYANPADFGGLVLGGYDQSRMQGDNLTTPLSGANNQTLSLSVKSIIAENVAAGTQALITDGSALAMTVDSTVSQLWLPQAVCDQFASAFGLTYDSSTELYLVNSTTHSQLLQLNPSITLTLASNSSSSETINIVLPYAAFDLNASLPIYNYSTPYFPIHVATGPNQYTLGRAFLQEAYVFVDWERQQFSVAQAVHQNSTSHIIPVLSPSDASNDPAPSHGLSTGAIAGIVVGAILVIGLALSLALFFVLHSRRRRRQQQQTAAAHVADHPEDHKAPVGSELHSDDVKATEVMSTPVHELGGDGFRSEVMSNPVNELPGHVVGQELDGRETHPTEMDAAEKFKVDRDREVYEMP